MTDDSLEWVIVGALALMVVLVLTEHRADH